MNNINQQLKKLYFSILNFIEYSHVIFYTNLYTHTHTHTHTYTHIAM